MNHRFLAALSCALACLLAPLPAAAQGKTLRFASAFDPQSMDPHALALLYQTRVVTQVYEGLVNRGKEAVVHGGTSIKVWAAYPTHP